MPVMHQKNQRLNSTAVGIERATSAAKKLRTSATFSKVWRLNYRYFDL